MVSTKLHVSTFTGVVSYIIFFYYPHFAKIFSYNVLDLLIRHPHLHYSSALIQLSSDPKLLQTEKLITSSLTNNIILLELPRVFLDGEEIAQEETENWCRTQEMEGRGHTPELSVWKNILLKRCKKKMYQMLTAHLLFLKFQSKHCYVHPALY
jgi:hypothetical protein